MSLNTALMWQAFDMPHIPFEARKELPKEAGVYVVYKEEQTLYIGKAHNLYLRFVSHHRLRQFISLCPGIEIAWRSMPEHSPEDRIIFEQSLIAFFKPRLNGKYYEGKSQSLLQQKREEAGITMTELAARVNMDLSKLSRLEHGHLQLKSTDLVALAIALGCKVEELLPMPEKEEPARV